MNKDELVRVYVDKSKAIDELAKQAYLSNLFAFNQDILKVEEGGEGAGKRVPLKQFHKDLCDFVSTNIHRKKIALMPRGHLKTTLVTVGYSLQRIARDPKVRILIANATGTMAEAMLSQIKKHLQFNETFKYYFGDLSSGASTWRDNMITLPTGEGSYQSKEATVTAYGLGGSLVSQHYDMIIVDDAHNRENINTKDQIEKVKQSYRDLLDLLEPGGQLIIIGCMVGDTKVTMADGSEKELCHIKVGDKIKTYDNGKLSTSTIKNWANQGRDYIFTITTSSGKIFKANERHPFLIYKNKKTQWIRVKNLHTGYKIVTLKDNGVSGKENGVFGKDVMNQPLVGGIVQNTTIKKDGLMDTTHHVLILGRFVTHISNIATGLRLKIMKLLSKNKTINVQYVEGHQVGGGQTKNTSALTTTTKREKLGVCYVMTVIWQWVTQRMKKMLSQSLNTLDFTLDEIVSIKKGGKEEVFDIEVEKTGNFIANGVVSSNTKWHDDDLYGQVMDKNNPEAREFDVFIRQAITDMKLGKEPNGHYKIESGNILWPEKYNLKALSALLNEKGLYEFSCQYQNIAVDDENAVFHKSWFLEYDPTDTKDRKMTRFTAIDPAVSLKERADFTAIVTIGVDVLGKIYVLEVKRGHFTEDQMVDELFITNEKFHPMSICIETVAFQKTLQHYIMKEIKRRGRTLPLNEVLPESDESKEKRIRLLQPMYMRGDVLHSKSVADIEYLEDELLRFPKGKHDDLIDALSYAVRSSFPPRQKEKSENSRRFLY